MFKKIVFSIVCLIICASFAGCSSFSKNEVANVRIASFPNITH
ncbi:MAG: hypothetical protein H6Q72_2543, partial [Firmicutes bacterium]|nr:hypothetical protein [Bacillota bacterium]